MENENAVRLVKATRETYLSFCRSLVNDPALFSRPEEFRPAVFEEEKAAARFAQMEADPCRAHYSILCGDAVAGDLSVKRIDREKGTGVLEICLTDDSFKDRGIGTAAERLAAEEAFGPLGLRRLLADCLLTNGRSIRALEKAGFHPYARRDGFLFLEQNRPRAGEEALRTAREIARSVRDRGGNVYYVGGFVRDHLLGLSCKDVDLEVHGIPAGELRQILDSFGGALSFGSSFGIYSLKNLDLDIALPRRETRTGEKHRDFEVDTDPSLGPEAAARRRDFTVNALMMDVLSGEILDFFGGRKDLDDGVLRHVDDRSFGEDPLRVLRGAQFAARFGLGSAPETVELCRGMDLSALSRERVEEELRKALLRSPRPSVFFETLRQMDQLQVWFPELLPLIGLEQDPLYHPEGDVWVHTMEVLDRAAAFREEVSDPYAFLLLALTHDLGKVLTTETAADGRIHAYAHESEGLPLVKSFLDRIVSRTSVRDYVLNMVPLHMKPNVVAFSKPSVKSTNHLFDSACEPEDLIRFSMCDRPVLAGDTPYTGDSDFLFERLAAYRETMARPFVQGRDLIDAGLEPGEDFSSLLAYAHKLRLAGIPKETALKQTLSLARKPRAKQENL